MRRLVTVWIVVSGLLVAGGANAVINMSVQQSGVNVVVQVSGRANTSALTLGSVTGGATGQIDPGALIYVSGTSSGQIGFPVIGPSSIGGSGSSTPGSTGSGDWVGIWFANSRVLLPTGYASGADLSGTSTYNNTTIAALGLAIGTYTWTWGTGSNADSLVLNIGLLAPTISSIIPTSGPTAGGTTITITGTDFTGATGITVGGNACISFNVASATSATCVTPAGTAGTASVEVTTAGGTNAANTLFTYTAPTPPAPQPIPTLSEWAQVMMMLAMIATAGFYGWRMKQR